MKKIISISLILLTIGMIGGCKQAAITAKQETYTSETVIEATIGGKSGQLGIDIVEGGEIIAPEDLIIDKEGNIFILDTVNNRVQKFNKKGNFVGLIKVDSYRIQIYDSKGEPLRMPKIYQADEKICVDNYGNLYILNTENKEIRKYNKRLKLTDKYSLNLDSVAAGMKIEANGDIIINGKKNNKTKTFKFNPNSRKLSETKRMSSAELYYPRDKKGNKYSLARLPDRTVILKFDLEGNFITEFEVQFSGGTRRPINVDGEGNIYQFHFVGDPYQFLKENRIRVIKWKKQ